MGRDIKELYRHSLVINIVYSKNSLFKFNFNHMKNSNSTIKIMKLIKTIQRIDSFDDGLS